MDRLIEAVQDALRASRREAEQHGPGAWDVADALAAVRPFLVLPDVGEDRAKRIDVEVDANV